MNLRSHGTVKYLTLITTFLVKVLTLNSDAFTYLSDNGQRHRDYTVIRAFKLHSCRPCNRARLYGNLQPNCNYFWRVVLLKKKNLQPTSGMSNLLCLGFFFFFFWEGVGFIFMIFIALFSVVVYPSW